MAGIENTGDFKIKPKHHGTKVIFENRILERLSRTHISIPISMYLALSAAFLFYAFRYTTLPGVYIPLLFLSGFFTFTLMEYLMHRFLFHMKPDKSWKKSLQYNMHGVHHEFPRDKDRLAMPPIISMLIAVGFFVIFYSLMNTKVFGFLPGIMTGYASYLFVHYIVHAYPVPTNWFKILWLNHSIHHYKDNTVVFGVSSPFWDYVFGTMPKKNHEIEKSGKIDD